MKANFTRNFRSMLVVAFASVAAFTISLQEASAQKWSGVHGNEWLENKYDQPWVRIGVTTKGIQRVLVSDLPADFKATYDAADKSKVAMYYRGEQIAIIKADAAEIIFYGVPHDGATDVLLYRLASSRRNPYYSIYSDEGAYFLTVNQTENGLRAQTPAVTPNPGAEELTWHNKRDVKIFKNQFSHTTLPYFHPPFMNSYFEDGKQATGTALYNYDGSQIYTSNVESLEIPTGYTPEPFSYRVSNYAGSGERRVSIHLKGRYGLVRARIHAGKTSATATRDVGNLTTTDFNDYDFSFVLDDADINNDGSGFLGFKSEYVTPSVYGGYSVSYYTVDYRQLLTTDGAPNAEFTFPAGNGGVQNKMTFSGVSGGTSYYDISQPNAPKVLTVSGGYLYADRDGTVLKVLASSAPVTVEKARIKEAKFAEIDPSDYDYLIVHAGSLKTSATAYAEYRRTGSPGKKYRPLVKDIADLYNQFNYGEPSPVAIRRYVDYMISDGDKNKYLLLIGKSNASFASAVREMPDEVPTVGYPGSDLLLTDGLGGVQDDVPALPTGRISALNNDQVLDYLAKVTGYEAQSNIAWRKKVIHVVGGKSTAEINAFKGYMDLISPKVTSTPFVGSVVPKVKTIAADQIEELSLATELNGDGIGMISYFGHGSYRRTDYNIGYVSDPEKNYNNPGKFPVVFYNGCGVNNIFFGYYGAYNSTKPIPVSLDWLLARDKGAIVVLGNTWDAYASNSNEYLKLLYPQIFSATDANRGTMGQILKDVAQQMKTNRGYTYNAAQNSRTQAGYYDIDRANIHQVLLQGDPALKVLISDSPLPVSLTSFTAKPIADQVVVTWATASEKNNSHYLIERSFDARKFETIGMVEGKGTTDQISNYTFADRTPLPGVSYYRLKQVDAPKYEGGQAIDGTVSESRIVVVERDQAGVMVVSPNPTADFVDVKLEVPTAIVGWSLTDVQGRVLKEGAGEKRIALTDLTVGNYILQIVTASGNVYKKKILKK